VLEVGTGTGILTDVLAARAGRVFTCDVDVKLQQITQGLRAWPDTVTFLAGDILASKHKLNPEIIVPWLESARRGLRARVIANLPYSIATPFLANVLWDALPVVDITVLVQKEAAERFTAAVGSRDYGPMAVAVALFARAQILRLVPPQVFWPEPKVHSALLRLVPSDPHRARELREQGLMEFLHDTFLHRRKMLRYRIDPEQLALAGIDPEARPEELDAEAWVRLLTVPPL